MLKNKNNLKSKIRWVKVFAKFSNNFVMLCQPRLI